MDSKEYLDIREIKGYQVALGLTGPLGHEDPTDNPAVQENQERQELLAQMAIRVKEGNGVTQEPLVSMEILDCLEQQVHLEIQEYLVQKETRV